MSIDRSQLPPLRIPEEVQRKVSRLEPELKFLERKTNSKTVDQCGHMVNFTDPVTRN